ncbi:hypothetical protein HFO94_08550 [Rhizobium leguminosarum]|uniref:hypothetical protein n=1 Tax=Rhizobium leguminosarum TaxID=384 RepID=UPI001C9493A3|nr:hypothetical protein [Rhizobium leguminosarum]MBY5353588.1 hypothetical protein [Rhizobium leguminosarum]MBY5370484.1 hypothetical protein [Rhizobium leguminosarum]MBY5667395.1 hypothetical protein [Rhizobium leguminosarum]MBY5710101.1 hypothetical protein [Rhizobium leguminosarum]MBY5721552.1 hypothetical protein [Rhizobium leguminosarum]
MLERSVVALALIGANASVVAAQSAAPLTPPTVTQPAPVPPVDRCGQEVPPPDCMFVLNPPTSSNGIVLNGAINIDRNIFLNLPKESLSIDGAKTLSPQSIGPINGR